jgi:tellurite methyltransferase
MHQFDAERFYSLTRDSPPWPLLIRAVSLLGYPGRALDLGAGAGRDTRFLLEHGFQVTAVDADPHAVAILSSLGHAGLQVVHSSFEDFAFGTDTFDLINAQFSLPFVPPDRFESVFARVKRALAPGGAFAGQLFGVHDEWNTPDRGMTFLTRQQSRRALRGLEIVEFREEDADGHVADGSPKHWHVFHILARRWPDGM